MSRPRVAFWVVPALLIALGAATFLLEREPQPPAEPARHHPDGQQVLAQLAARLDRDGDGRISAEEYERYSNHRHAFSSLDLDGDSALDPGELERAVRSEDPGYANERPR